MASTLPGVAGECCPPTCTEPTSIQVPGPAGAAGTNGTNGAAGADSYSTFTSIFTFPAELGTAVAAVDSTAWMSINQIVFLARADGSVSGYFQITVIGGATSVTLRNLEDAASSAYLSNSAPGSTITVGGKISPAGLQGPSVNPSGAIPGASDLRGTYDGIGPKLKVGNAKGSLIVGNGTDSVEVPVSGTNGHLLRSNSVDTEGLDWFQGLPLTGDANISKNRLGRLSATTGLPIPIVSSKTQINDPGSVTVGETGALVLDASAGNARGVDAVDLQVATRTNVAMVASGAESFLGGGDDNTVSGARGVCGGGDGNTVSSVEGFVGGGEGNQAITGDRTVVCGGQNNVASGTESFIGGGEGHIASATRSTVAGGLSNTASGAQSAIGGGQSNTASSDYATISGGIGNTASAEGAVVVGGTYATSDKHGQVSHAAGRFVLPGDAQTFELVLRRGTTDDTASELFLDGASLRATIPTNTTWAFHLHTVARDSNGATAESAAWEVKGAISNDNGTTSLVAAVTSVTLADDTAGTWVHAVTANDANDALVVTVTGEIGRTVRWVCHMRVVQVAYL